MKTKSTTIILSCLSAFGLLSQAGAAEVELTISGDPIETGSGANLTARYQNVATVNGTSVDLFAEILSQSTNKTNDFWQGGPYALPGDFVFSFNDMVIGETRQATVRWSFYESGTTTPVVFEEFSVTVDDLDNVPSGGGGRIETLTATDAVSYTIDTATNLSIDDSVSNQLSTTGSTNQDPGDSEGAIKFRFANISSFTMTYHTEPTGAVNSAFHHDGHGAFVFDNPDETKLPVRLFYTYYFTNAEVAPVTIDFADTLPAGLVWDTTLPPLVNGPLTGGIPVYADGDTTVSITGLILQSGDSSLTLATLETLASGSIVNDGAITPTDPSGPAQNASASIALP